MNYKISQLAMIKILTQLKNLGADSAIKELLTAMLPIPDADGRYKYQDMVNAIPKIFAMMENIISANVVNVWGGWRYSKYFDYRNLASGDKNEFTIGDDLWITANTFSGYTWDTDREKLIGNNKVIAETEWYYVHVYDYFERFLSGEITFDFIVDKISNAFIKKVIDEIAILWYNTISENRSNCNYSELSNIDAIEKYIRKMEAVSKTGNVSIIGTKTSLSTLNNLSKIEYMSDNLIISGRWEKHEVIIMPEIINDKSNLSDNIFMIVPEIQNKKFIKFVDEGEIRGQFVLGEVDDSLGFQIQRKFGFFMDLPSVFCAISNM